MHIVSDDSIQPPSGAPWLIGRHIQLDVIRAQVEMRSDYYLVYLPWYRVKVRCDYIPSADRVAALEAFVRNLVPALVNPQRSSASS
ncbi:MAG TPA: hypothetical protein VJR24_02050 [Gemmatimonadaceae bacterium]|nr:hypothetical protein [Gemmatimonadaceae bacterium]